MKFIVFETVERQIGEIDARNRDHAERIMLRYYAARTGLRLQSAASLKITEEENGIIERNKRLARQS